MYRSFAQLFRHIFLCLVLFFIPIFPAAADDAIFSSLISAPSGAVEAGSGGITVQTPNLLETSGRNSAALAPFLRPGLTGDFIYSDMVQGYGAGGFLPIPWGTIGLQYNYFNVTGMGGHLIRLHLAKKYSPRISLGLQLKSYILEKPGQNLFGLLAEPGMMIHMPRYGLNIFSQLKNLPISGDPWSFAPTVAVSAGFEWLFINKDNLQSWMLFELTPDFSFREYPGALSWGISYDFIQFRLGTAGLFAPSTPVSYTAGIGFQYGSGLNRITFQYGLHYLPGPAEELRHHISIGGVIDTQDTTPPQVSVTTPYNIFSPNGDGSRDVIHFQVKVIEPDPIFDWTFTIYNSKDEPIRTWSRDRRLKIDEYQPGQIFIDTLKRRESRYIPAEFTWDGRYDPRDLSEEAPADEPPAHTKEGVFHYSLVVTDLSGNTNAPVTGEFYLDNGQPEIEVLKPQEYYVLDPKGRFKKISFIQKVSAQKEDIVTGFIENISGKVVRSYQWTVQETPYRLNWEGETDQGDLAPPGYYRYRAKITDSAGNYAAAQSDYFGLYRSDSFHHLQLSSTGFSPNGDGEFDNLTLELMTPNWKDVVSHEVVIYRLMQGTHEKEIIRTWKNEKNPEQERVLTWDGNNTLGHLAKEGRYFIEGHLKTKQGETLTGIREVSLDLSPPKSRLITSGALFTPDGDGLNDTYTFSLYSKDPAGVKACSLRIYELYHDGANKARRFYRDWNFPGKCPSEITWDGTDWAGYKARSQARFLYEIELVDHFMNRSISHSGIIKTGVLVKRHSDYYSIRLSMLDFAPGNIRPGNLTRKNLEEVIATIKKYPDYRIKIESHTSNRGNEEDNLMLSEKRAQFIMNYLLDKGFKINDLAFQGIGEVSPVRSSDDPYFTKINERFEFILMPR